MKQSHVFLTVRADRAKSRHQLARRKLHAAKAKRQKSTTSWRQIESPGSYPTPSSVGEDIGEESDVDEVHGRHNSSTPLSSGRPAHFVDSPHPDRSPFSLYQRKNARKEGIDDIFSATGNLDVPYYINTYQSKQSGVSQVLNYYFQVAGPLALWRPQLIDGDNEPFRRTFFQLSMQEPVMFETVVAISQAYLDLSESPGSQPSAAVLQHRGKVLRMLHANLLASHDPKIKDTDLIAVFCMMTLDIMYRDWSSVEANMHGFLHMARVRGGIDQLGWQGWFQKGFSWVELRWAGHIARVSSPKKSNTELELPTYPGHPFNPATCLSISHLPEGLSEAALQLQLSNEVIRFLERVETWTTRPHPADAEAWTRQPIASYSRSRDDYQESLRISIHGADILADYILMPIERVLCIGVFAYIISTDGSVDDGRQPRGLEDHMVDLQAVCEEMTHCEHLLWAGLAVAASTDWKSAPLANHWVLLDRVMELAAEDEFRTWDDVKEVLRKYFWNPFIEAKWKKCWQAAMERKIDLQRPTRFPDAGHREEFARSDATFDPKPLWQSLSLHDLANASNGNASF